MSIAIYNFTRLRTCKELRALIQQTVWDYPYWPELDDDLANEVVMDFVAAVTEYRQSLVHSFVVREEPVIGVYVVEQAELEQTITDLMKKLEGCGLSVYTVIETLLITRGGVEISP